MKKVQLLLLCLLQRKKSTQESWVPSLISQTFIEHLLYARCYFRPWGCHRDQDGQSSSHVWNSPTQVTNSTIQSSTWQTGMTVEEGRGPRLCVGHGGPMVTKTHTVTADLVVDMDSSLVEDKDSKPCLRTTNNSSIFPSIFIEHLQCTWLGSRYSSD